MIRIAVHRCEGAVLVAACDSELVGRRLSEGKLKLEVCEAFYGCDEYEEGALANFLRVCSSANLAGKRAVAAAVKAGFIDKGCVLVIDGVPHAHMYVV